MTTDDLMVRRLHLLRLEHLAAEVVSVLRTAGVDVVLLKGPVTNTWLYGGADARAFRDVDVLIRPSHLALAGEALVRGRFIDLHAPLLPLHRPSHERTWTRDGLLLDVHTSLAGIPPARAGTAFQRLWDGQQPFDLQGGVVPVLAESARAVHLALHAAQSRADGRALGDLARGLDQLPAPLWTQAVDEAVDLGCATAAAAGLRKVVGGSRLATELEARSRPTTEVRLRSRGASIEAQNLWEALSCGGFSHTPRRLSALLRPPGTGGIPLRTRLSAGGRTALACWVIASAATRTRLDRAHLRRTM